MSMPAPTSADLLLAFHVRDLAMTKRRRAVRNATGLLETDPELESELEKWDKSLDFYIEEVIHELDLVWSVMNGEKLDLR